MGKKPVLTMVGLVWAGLALTGCNTCTNCRNTGSPKYSASPAFQSRNTKTDAPAPTMVGDSKSAPAPDAMPGRMPDSVTSPASMKSTGIEQAGGMSTGSSGVVPASAPSLSRPTSQTNLRPTEERAMPDSFSTPPAAPKALDDGFSSRTTSGEPRSLTMPKPPVPMPSAPSAPPATTAMPAMTTPTPTPAAPPVPEAPGKSLPPISSSSSFDPGMPPAPPGR